MGKKIVLIAGVLVAAGTVAAMSSPGLLGQHGGRFFDDLLDGFERTATRISQSLNVEDAGGANPRKGWRDRAHARADDDGAEQELRPRRGKRFGAERDGAPGKDDRFGKQSEDDATAEEGPSRARERTARRSAGRDSIPEDQREKRRGQATAGLDRKAGQLFRALDTNGDGVIDAAEFASALRQLDAGGETNTMREAFARFARRFAKLDLDDGGQGSDVGSPLAKRAPAR
jgi:EF-hand domain